MKDVKEFYGKNIFDRNRITLLEGAVDSYSQLVLPIMCIFRRARPDISQR